MDRENDAALFERMKQTRKKNQVLQRSNFGCIAISFCFFVTQLANGINWSAVTVIVTLGAFSLFSMQTAYNAGWMDRHFHE